MNSLRPAWSSFVNQQWGFILLEVVAGLAILFALFLLVDTCLAWRNKRRMIKEFQRERQQMNGDGLPPRS
ncbi:MAG: hypothetical protein ABSH38_12835 [Verrucomicrobiota bacterium]